MDRKVLISCEHAGNEVPSAYRHLFEKNPEILQTHRGLDIGALELTQTFGKVLEAEIHTHAITRLLVDLNRSLSNPEAFSEFMDDLDRETLNHVVDAYYLPHRNKLEQLIEESVNQAVPVLHVSVHTFTPQLNGRERNADVGFLYDPQREKEQEFCRNWRKELSRKLPELKYRMNYPYRGTMDGFTTHLRKKFSDNEYMGIEIEVNQKFAEAHNTKEWELIQEQIAVSLNKVIREYF